MDEANQLSVGVVDWLAARFTGEDSVTCPGSATAVVNDQVLEGKAEPELFLATTFQKYAVPEASAWLTT